MDSAGIVDEAGGAFPLDSGPPRNEGDCREMWWLVDELEKERRGQIVTSSHTHGLIAKCS
jgi:hypothetical protein